MADQPITTQKLIYADKDADTLGEATNEVKVVIPRYGEPYKSIPLVSKEYDQNSGTKGFNTLAEFEAAKATIPANTVVTINEAGANQGQNIWDGLTLTKSGYDPLTQAKVYFDDSLEIQNKNLCAVDTLKISRYVNASGSIEANPDTAMHVLPVEAGKTYAVKASSFLASAFYIALRATNSIDVGATLGLVTLTDTADATVKNFSIAADSAAQYAFINVLLPGLSFDIRSSIIVNEGTIADSERVTKIKNVEISDEYARSVMLQDSDITFADNLYSGINQASRYVNTLGSIEANPDTAMHVLPVEAGKTYAVKASSLPSASFFVAFRASSSVVTGATLGLATLNTTKDPNAKTFIVPEGVTHAFINVLLPSLGLNIQDSLIIQQSNMIVELSAITKIKDNPMVDLVARALIEGIDTVATSPLKSKKWLVIGDSITHKNDRSHFNYHYYLAENVDGMTVYNYGISGTGFFNRHDVASKITQTNVDLITVFLGTNDYGNQTVENQKQLGVFGDTGTTTISGCINTTLSGLINKFPLIPIAIFTPLPRATNYGLNAANNAYNYNLKDLVDLLHEYATHYSLPILDLYAISNLYPWLPASNEYYFKPFEGSIYGTTPDGLHPNDAGHQLLARKMQQFLESI